MFRFVLTVICLAAIGTSLFAAEVTSFIEPYRDIDVASPEMGTLEFIYVKEGDHVTKGQVLAGLDDDVLQAALAMAATAKSARGRLNSAEAELRLKANRLNKVTGLFERHHASEEEVTRAKAQVEIAEAQVEAVRDELHVKQADYQRITAQIEQKRIKSPIDGIVTNVYKDAGEFVSASEPVVVKVVQLDPLMAEFSVPIFEAKSLSVNQEVALTIGDDRQSTPGLVEFVSPTADAQSGTARVKIRVANPDGAFQSGAACWLDTDQQPNVAQDQPNLAKAEPSIPNESSNAR